MYNKIVMHHFSKPKNIGEINNADGVGKVGNPVCGDIMWLYIKVNKKNNTIKNIKFKTMGCAAAIATSSMVTELAKGKTIEYASKITKQDIVNELEGLPPQKIHCSILATEALIEAIYDYLTKNKLSVSERVQTEHERIIKTPICEN